MASISAENYPFIKFHKNPADGLVTGVQLQVHRQTDNGWPRSTRKMLFSFFTPQKKLLKNTYILSFLTACLKGT
jgi:hypothetical protein